MSTFKELCEELESVIQKAYDEPPTIAEAEKLASKFLYAQMLVSNELTKADLNARTRKSGVKAIRAAVYLDEVQKSDKKPSDTLLNAMVDSHEMVNSEQQAFDAAEVDRADLERKLDIFQQGHIFARQLSKGNFNG